MPPITITTAQLWGLLAGAALGLAVLLILSGLAAVYLTRLPADHFESGHRRTTRVELGWSVLGWVCVAAGVAMLVLPGQGLLTILAGLLMAEYPGKRKVERWVFRWRQSRAAIGLLRRRAGRPELLWPEAWLD